MKRVILTIMAALFSFAGAYAQGDWAGFNRYAKDNRAVQQKVSEAGKAARVKAVFFGDSITDGWANRHDPEFFTAHNFAGRGISGQTTSHMLVRLRRDVLDLQPKYMVFLGGINDIAQNNGAIDVENVYGNIVSIIELARLYKIKPVICLVFPTTYIPWRREVEDVAAKIEQLNGLLKAYAAEHKIPFINYFEDIELVDGRLPENLSADGVHPTLEGYKIMEEKILPVLK